MMTLSEEVLQQIKEMSSALLPPGEIAILLNIPVDQRDFFCDICKNHHSSPIYTAYHQGRLPDQAQPPENSHQTSYRRQSCS